MSILAHSTKAKGLSIALIAVFALASLTSIAQFASAQEGGMPSTYNVSWQKETPIKTDNGSWTNVEWIYGPSITIDVAYLNGTSLLGPTGGFPSHYLFPGYQFYVNITVPKGLIELGRNMSSVSFSMNKCESYNNGTTTNTLWSANIFLSYCAYSMEGPTTGPGKPSLPQDPWNFCSSFWNYTGGAPASGGTGGPMPIPPALFIPSRGACRFIETDDLYCVWFQGELNASISACGNFWYNFNTMDTKGSQIMTMGNRGGILVVVRPDPSGMYGPPGDSGHYYCYIVDRDGKKTQSVSPGTQFKIVFEIFGTTDVNNITLFLQPPVSWDWFWNYTKNTRQIAPYRDIVSSEWWFNNTAGEWEYKNELRSEYRTVRVVCDVSSGTFNLDEGFQYWAYTAPNFGNWSRIYHVNMTGSSTFYTFNGTGSDSNLSDNKIEFALTIPQNTNASAGNYGFETDAVKNDGRRLCGNCYNQFIILGDNVVKIGLLKATTESPLLKILPGKYFRAKMEIMGKEGFRNAVTSETSNITFVFSPPPSHGFWSVGDVDYNRDSCIKFIITRNTLVGVTYVEVFNNTYTSSFNRVTCQSNYTYVSEKLNEANYVQMASNDFSVAYESSTNILTLFFNLTFKVGVPEGYYYWDAYLANRHDCWYEYYDTSCNETLRYSAIRPESMNILVGTVESYWYLYNTAQTWSVDSESGALDLDGNNMTKADQFYVKRIYTSTSYWTQGGERMFVTLNWGPYSMHSYFALMNYSWRYEWSECYIWIYPGNRSTVPHDRFLTLINGTIWDLESNTVRPEYCQISQLTANKTWDRIKSQYSEYSWWKEEYKWTWLEVNFNQNFFTANPYGTGGSSNNLFFQYAGLLVFNDTDANGVLNMGFESGSAVANELTHYFMFEGARGIILSTPYLGESGSVQVNVDSSVSWGVSVLGLNGTTYPAQIRGYGGFAGLGWWWHDCYGTYLNEGDFSTVPSKVGVESLNFTAHFEIPHPNLAAGAVNELRLKIDEGVGAWTLYDQSQSQLRNYSMAIAFLASSNNWQYSFKTTGGEDMQTDGNSKASDYYNITQNGVKLANIQMGGADYTWGKDGSARAMHSSTTPMSAFTAMYSAYSMTGSGAKSTCSFSMTGSNYFMTSSFKHWDGYSVYTDPYFAIFQANSGQQGTDGGLGGIPPIMIIGVASIAIVALAAFVMVKKRKSAPASISQPEQKQVP